MEKKRSVGVYIGSILTMILSLLACIDAYIGGGISYVIVNGGWLKALTFLSRTEPFIFILSPLSYILVLCKIEILVPFFLIICGLLLLKGKNWVRIFLLVYCYTNMILLIISYFLQKLFDVATLAVLNRKTFMLLSQIPNFKSIYFYELNPLNHNIFQFLLFWILPLSLNCLFIIYFTRPKIKEQF